MKLSFALTILTIGTIERSESGQVRNSERMTISLENFDDLEMIPESENHEEIVKKLENFHDYVKRAKVVKHPWEKLFLSDSEYKKLEETYHKHVRGVVKRAKEFSGPGGKHRRTGKSLLINKRDLVESKDADEDDDEGEVNDNLPLDVDQEKLRQEYEKQINEEEDKEKSYKYSDKGKPEENFHDALQKVLDVKTPENCTNMTGFGIKSLECIIKNYKDQEMTRKEAFVKFMKIFLIWIDIYISIAIPLWCIKGWCCCCIRWKYCRPKALVNEIKRYIAENPPGVYINEDGEEEHYAPTLREKELFDQINRNILSM